MIDLGPLAGLHEHQHELHAYCLRCDRWAKLDLAAMIAAKNGDRRLPIRIRCQICGEIGRLQVRRPTPIRGSGGLHVLKSKTAQQGLSLRMRWCGGALLRLQTDRIEVELR